MDEQRPARDVLLEDLSAKSAEYARKATQLSNLLVQAEDFLQAMPGKREVATDRIDSFQLRFEKTNKGWRLVISKSSPDGIGPGVFVTESGLILKAEAATRLPELYKSIVVQFDSALALVDQGLEALRELPFLDADNACDELQPSLFSEADPEPERTGGFPDDEIPF